MIKSTCRKAFTMIELLTVIAITALLLTIIVEPIFQSFNFVNLAQAYSNAQLSARHLMDSIGRQVSNGTGVRDNSGDKGALDFYLPTAAGSTNPYALVRIPYTKLDIIEAAKGEPTTGAAGFINPTNGKLDPTLHSPQGQPVLPVVPSLTIVRYFIALRDPFVGKTDNPAPYNNPYNALLGRGTGEDNLFVLYRAEVHPYRLMTNIITGVTTVQANPNFFAADASGMPIIDDPDFMIPDGTAAKAKLIRNWLTRSVIQTEVAHYDMLQPVYNKYTQKVTYVPDGLGDQVPELVPLLQFRPAHVANETAEAMNTLRLGDENNSEETIGSDVFRTKFGGWDSTIIHYFSGLNPVTPAYQLLGFTSTRSDGTTGFSIYSTPDGINAKTELFDESAYVSGLGATPYPFTNGILAANARSGWLGSAATYVAEFKPFYFDSQEGKVYASFGINEVGLKALAPNASDPTGSRPNLPLVNEGTMTIPSNGTVVSPFAGPAYTINDAFNTAYVKYPELQNNLKRFIDLRVTPNEDGTFGPLFPSQSNWPFGSPNVVANGLTNGFPQASIVPGSEVIYGPDALPGPNYGQIVRYTRVTQGNPGPDQYKINYSAIPEPSDWGLLGANATDLSGFNANVYDPTNPVSALLQAQFEPGYITLDSDPNTPLPNSIPFKISYRFQFSGATDAVSVDYDTRQELNLQVTIRNYPNQTLTPNPQTVTLQTTLAIRNFIR